MPLKRRMVFLSVAFALALAGCSLRNEQAVERGSETPVLVVKQQNYQFSMYPQYVDESKSLIKLDVRDNKGQFVTGAVVKANLRAADGHLQAVAFREDAAVERYVADVPLKHHEDYVVDAVVSFRNETFKPEFVFHCGDPVPELVELRQEGSENK